jgi:hypothetical protein
MTIMRIVHVVGLALVLVLAGARESHAGSCGASVCPSAGEWQEGKTLDAKARKKEAKANKKKSDVTLRVAAERGSVFVDGRYLAPDATRAIKPGKHELELREGDEVLALGVLVVPKGAESIVVEIDP